MNDAISFCYSVGLDKAETGDNLLMEMKCIHQMLNFSYSHWFACGQLLFLVWSNSIIIIYESYVL